MSSMKPAKLDIDIAQGETWVLTVTLAEDDGTAIDISGGSGQCQIRTQPGGQVLASPTVTVTDGAAGEFELSLTYTQTAALAFSTAYYDVALTYNSIRQYPIEGRVTLKRRITEWA